MTSNGNKTEWECNSGSNWVSDFKSAKCIVQDWFEIIASTITPESCNTKSYYQLIVSITKCETLFKSTAKERHWKSKENISKYKSFVQPCFQSALVSELT